WAEYVLFAIIFAFMAYFYTYMNPVEIEAQFTESEDKKMKEHEMMTKDNLAYVNNETSQDTDIK
ncbi:hypothetical protein M9458_013331, partial [Cirrhinus mrigala]